MPCLGVIVVACPFDEGVALVAVACTLFEMRKVQASDSCRGNFTSAWVPALHDVVTEVLANTKGPKG